MTFDQIPDGTEVFLDANTLIYHFTNEPVFGAACTGLIERIERSQVSGYTSALVLSDAAHRLMTIEAMNHFGWPITGLATRLRKHHSEIPKLSVFQNAIEQVPQLGIRVWDIKLDTVLTAAKLSRQHELLSGDALVVAVMQAHDLTHVATNDSDFDRVPWIVRFAPA